MPERRPDAIRELLGGLEDAQARDLEGTLRALAAMAPRHEPPPGLTAGVMAAVGRAAAAAPGPEPGPALAPPSRRRRVRLTPVRLSLAGLALATGVAAVLAVLLVTGRGPGGTLELERGLRAPTGAATAHVTVRALGTGRDVHVTSDTLPGLPADRVYELWFVGPGDAPGARNRISGGTFHPDAAGRTDLHLHAAADPAKYPTVEVTRERSGGDPATSGTVVVRSRTG